jgi:hypothetical protein
MAGDNNCFNEDLQKMRDFQNDYKLYASNLVFFFEIYLTYFLEIKLNKLYLYKN